METQGRFEEGKDTTASLALSVHSCNSSGSGACAVWEWRDSRGEQGILSHTHTPTESHTWDLQPPAVGMASKLGGKATLQVTHSLLRLPID